VDFTRLESGAIEWRVTLGEGAPDLWIRATNLRSTNTGVHARIAIGLDETEVDFDTFNLNRRGDRGTLVNSALKDPLMADVKDRCSQLLPPAMRAFTASVWSFHVQDDTPEYRGGSVERTGPAWLMEPYVLKESGTILFAPPGRGKSWTGLLWALVMDAGLDFPFKADPHRVMYVNLERGPTSMDARLGDLNYLLGLPRDRQLLRYDRRGRSLMDVWDAVDAAVKREGVECVFLDSLSRAGAGDMNTNDVANRTMDALNALGGVSWVTLGHTPRGDETHVFGSQMYTAAADLEIQLLTERKADGTLGAGTKGAKANDVALPPLTIIAYEFDKLGLSHLRIARPGEFLRIENENANLDLVGQITDYLTQGAASATEIATNISSKRSTVASALSRNPGLFTVVGKEGKATLYGNVTHETRNVSSASATGRDALHVPRDASRSLDTDETDYPEGMRHEDEAEDRWREAGFR